MTIKTSARNRRSLNAFVSHDAHERWHDFAAHNGVTVSALLEALSEHLIIRADGPVDRVLGDAVKSARLTDARRRRRR